MTPFATTLAPWQACSIWADLENAWAGHASHGHGAEIYAYRLRAANPSAETAIRMGADAGGTIYEGDALEAAAEAMAALVSVCRAFETHRSAMVMVNGKPLDEAANGIGFTHRVMVTVIE